MTDDLRSALTDGDTDTPAGIDVTAVRARADRIRRRRMALATAAAAATAVAVAVPVAVLRSGTDPATPAASGRPVAVACPDAVPARPDNRGPGLDRALVPFAADRALVCTYRAAGTSTGGLTGVVPLSAAEARAAVDRLAAAGRVTTGLQVCTSEFGYPFVLQVGDGGRVVTLRLEPYGCARVTNGAWEGVLGQDKELLRSLGDRAAKSTTCAERVDVPPAVRTDGEAPGDTLLPTDTRRLLVCLYQPTGERVPAGKARWNAVASPADTARLVAGLNASPQLQPGAVCTRDAGPLLVLLAVTPDGVVPATANAGGCGAVDNGVRTVAAKEIVQELAEMR